MVLYATIITGKGFTHSCEESKYTKTAQFFYLFKSIYSSRKIKAVFYEVGISFTKLLVFNIFFLYIFFNYFYFLLFTTVRINIYFLGFIIFVKFLFINQNNQRGETSFWLFWKVRKIGFPFSHSASRPFATILGESGVDIFEVTDVERRPRSNFLDHFHYSQAVTFWVMALNR